MINIEIRMTLFMRGRLVMQIEFMVKSYGALRTRCPAIVNAFPCLVDGAVRNQDNQIVA